MYDKLFHKRYVQQLRVGVTFYTLRVCIYVSALYIWIAVDVSFGRAITGNTEFRRAVNPRNILNFLKFLIMNSIYDTQIKLTMRK